jgi:hypothetical protein
MQPFLVLIMQQVEINRCGLLDVDGSPDCRMRRLESVYSRTLFWCVAE